MNELLTNSDLNSTFLDAATKYEIGSITGNLNSRKTIRPNSTATHILKEFKNIYTQNSINNNYQYFFSDWNLSRTT